MITPRLNRSCFYHATWRVAGLRHAPSKLHYRCKHGDGSHHRPSKVRIGVSHAPLSILPLSAVIRSFVTSIFSSSPVLLPISLRILHTLAHTTNPLFDVSRNWALRAIVDRTLYDQFCAGESASEVRKAVADVKSLGFSGVILAYAKEAPVEPNCSSSIDVSASEEDAWMKSELDPWVDATLRTVQSLRAGDYVAIKFTGAGRMIRHRLRHRMPPGERLDHKIHEICKCARDQGVRLAIDGEQHEMQLGVDDWTLMYAKEHNKCEPVIYGTYQAYKRSTGDVLSRHLNRAQQENFSLGVKLVRGAYLELDPRELIFDSKEETDENYDRIAASVLKRQWCKVIHGSGAFPNVSLMLATHNAQSVHQAYNIVMGGNAKSEIVFAQLQGMADEISCGLVEANRAFAHRQAGTTEDSMTSILPVYKYMAWGSTLECMKYLCRRAEENRDAVERTRRDRDAMGSELLRRLKEVFSK